MKREDKQENKECKEGAKPSKGRRNSRNGNRGRKPNSGKSNNPRLEEPKQLSATKGDDINDSSFYYTDNTLKEQITNFSFNQFAGVPFKVGNVVGSSVELDVTIPTIMKIKLNPNAGMNYNNTNFDVTDGVFRAGLKNYYMLSAGNAKTTNYQPQNVTMLLFAIASIMEYESFLQRILGTPYIFNMRNRDLPKKLIEAQGINYLDLTQNMAAYRVRFNTILQMFNKIPVPQNVRAFMKSSALYSNYYTDDTSPMAQFYVMMPDKLWILNEEVEPSALQATVIAVPGSPTLFGTCLNQLESMINRLLTSATFNYIFADILRLSDKGNVKVFQYGLIPDAYVAPILYSHEFNLWIDNAIILSAPNGAETAASTGGNTVHDDINNNSLKYSPNFDYIFNHEISEYVLNFDENNPSTEDRVAATRLVAAYKKMGENTAKACCSTHYITELSVLDGDDAITIPAFNLISYYSGTTASQFVSILRVFDVLSKFKHAPHIHAYNGAQADENQYTLNSSNYDFYTTVDYDFLNRMFDAEWLAYLTIGE